jgi:SARP family transcriptional regulator, regulator of embCAB operon
MRFEILRPLRIIGSNGEFSINAPRVESVLRTLLVRCNEIVSVDQLIAEIWGERPPRRATASLHVHVSNLRKFFNMVGEGESAAMTTHPRGYMLRVRQEDLDALMFQHLVRLGHTHRVRGDHEQACRVLERALDLWAGPNLPELPSGSIVGRYFARLEEVRLECLEMHIESGLALRRHRTLVSLLYELINEYPLHEVFYAQVMRALYHCGRRGDALQVYQQAHHVLSRELGIAPSIMLRDLQRAVLSGSVHVYEESPVSAAV